MQPIPFDFKTLAEKHLGTGFPNHLGLPEATLPPEARQMILRVLRLMKQSRYSISQFNPILIRWLFTTLPRILPGAWEKQIPPITMPNRHSEIDDYVAAQHFPPGEGPPVFVDLGCGFPPVTTVDTAGRFPDWQVLGVDPSFAKYILWDPQGRYACFNPKGRLLYFQPSMDMDQNPLYSDAVQTKSRFIEQFNTLFPLLSGKDHQACETVEKYGCRLIRNHIRNFETAHLRFIESGLADLEHTLSPKVATVFRCMNLLVYFDCNSRKQMIQGIHPHLKDGGLLIAGTNSFGIQARYIVFQKKVKHFAAREFAFSLDNLGHISTMPWFTFHDRDPETELLARLSSELRATPSFWTGFCSCLDALLSDHGICRRKADGVLHFPEQMVSPDQFLKKSAMVWDKMIEKGYLKGAAKALANAGYTAWINPAGHVGVRPPAGYFS